MKNIVELTDSNFNDEVISSDKPVLVDFWAEWCMPCRMLGPILEKVADTYAGKVKVGKLNVDTNPVSASSYKVTGIPTLLMFKDGNIVDNAVGLLPEDALQEMIEKYVSNGKE